MKIISICRSLLLSVSTLLFVACSSQPPAPPIAPAPQELSPPSELLSEAEINRVGELYGPLAEARVRFWQNLIVEQGEAALWLKLQKVNNFFNQARFVDDEDIWQQSDYWATPLEFLIMDAGDCEDFSVAKYFTLKQMGVDEDKMRLTAVKAVSLNKAHMVLAYYDVPSEEPLILDNIDPRILPASKRMDLIPVYSFNGEDLWLAKTRTQVHRAEGKADTIKSWVSLKQRRSAGVPLLQQVLIPPR